MFEINQRQSGRIFYSVGAWHALTACRSGSRLNKSRDCLDCTGPILKPVFNNMRLPLEMNLAPRGVILIIGAMFTPLFNPGGVLFLLTTRKTEGQTGGFHP
jgi:hypothetical protein